MRNKLSLWLEEWWLDSEGTSCQYEAAGKSSFLEQNQDRELSRIIS